MNSTGEQLSDRQAPTATLHRGNVYTPSRVSVSTGKEKGYLIVKRLADILLSLFGLILLSPLFLIVAMAIKLDSKGPVFYSQTRVGKNGKHFTMYKFRSMVANADSQLKDLQELNERDGPVFKIHNDPRVTRVGDIIRKTCIDELPQLLNVFRGDISIVGPRPLPVYEVAQCTQYQMARLNVTPGLTCFWQISDRNMTFDEWTALDIKYINERSFFVDLKIFLKTFLVMFGGRGAK